MTRRRSGHLFAVCVLLAAVLALGSIMTGRAATQPVTLTVDQSSPACSDARLREAVTATAPWCTLQPASTQVLPGDVVSVRPGAYTAFRPMRSGTPDAKIRYVVSGGPVVLMPAEGSANAVMLVRVSWLRLDGFTVTGATGNGIWVEDATDIELVRLKVRDNAGAGVALRRAQRTIVWRSKITGNGRAGIIEYEGSSGNHVTRDTITGNGRDGNPYNGDGVQLAGRGTLVANNVISDNGDAGGFEHGVYAGASADGYVIEHNTVAGGPGAAIKARGVGAVRYNRIGSGLFGIVLSDNPREVSVVGNVIGGAFQHAIAVMADKTPGQAKLWHNTVVQQGRSTTSGNAAAVFVMAAGTLDLRNNLICYIGADNLGPALWVDNAARVASLRTARNWLCTTDQASRGLAWNGSLRTLAGWQDGCGCDVASIVTRPPSFDARFRVTSKNYGVRRGQSLHVRVDVQGKRYPRTRPDVGAYQSG